MASIPIRAGGTRYAENPSIGLRAVKQEPERRPQRVNLLIQTALQQELIEKKVIEFGSRKGVDVKAKARIGTGVYLGLYGGKLMTQKEYNESCEKEEACLNQDYDFITKVLWPTFIF